ncbi:hypothetical protein LCGC14_1033460 [marine sediment metagenome]|uniref:Uncharacterized protein n=1 Tax=marine sediment metagenome TaxID=412755 RepID=A0A0F9QZX5_9ZZZZ
MLLDTIEDILFKEKHLDKLKELINRLYDHSITPKEFKTYFLKQKAKNLQEIFELFPYYAKQIKINNSLHQYTRDSLSSELRNELQEKDKFLEQVGIRVNYLVNKLNKKLQS